MEQQPGPSTPDADDPYRPVAVNWQAGQAFMRPLSSKAKGKRPMRTDDDDGSYDDDHSSSLFRPLQKRIATSLQAASMAQASTSMSTQSESVPSLNGGRPIRRARRTAVVRSYVDAYDPETTAAFEDYDMVSSEADEPAGTEGGRRLVMNDNDPLIDEEEDPVERFSESEKADMRAFMRRLIRPYRHLNLPPLPKVSSWINPHVPLINWPKAPRLFSTQTQPALQEHVDGAGNAGPSRIVEETCAIETTAELPLSCSMDLTASDDDDTRDNKRRRLHTPPMRTREWDRSFARLQASQKAFAEYKERLKRYNEQFPDLPYEDGVGTHGDDLDINANAVSTELDVAKRAPLRQERFTLYRDRREQTVDSSDTSTDTGLAARTTLRLASPLTRRDNSLERPFRNLQIGQARVDEMPTAQGRDVGGLDGGDGSSSEVKMVDRVSDDPRPSAVIDMLDRIYPRLRSVASATLSQQQKEAGAPAEIDFPLPLEFKLPAPIPAPPPTAVDCCSCQPQPVNAPVPVAALVHPSPNPGVEKALVRPASKEPQQIRPASPGPEPRQPESTDRKTLAQNSKSINASTPAVASKPPTFVRGFTDYINPKRSPSS